MTTEEKKYIQGLATYATQVDGLRAFSWAWAASNAAKTLCFLGAIFNFPPELKEPANKLRVAAEEFVAAFRRRYERIREERK